MKSLKTSVKEYFALRRSFGYKLIAQERLLESFLIFLRQHNADYITTNLALQWAKSPKNAEAVTWAQRLTTVRLFARYRSVEDPRTEIPPPNLLSRQTHRAIPYIYSDEEINLLLTACHSLYSKGLRHHTYYTFFGLLAVTGCRVGELIALDRDDLNRDKKLLMIRETKFRKSRLVPLHHSTFEQLDKYEELREQFCTQPKANNFFLSEEATQLTDSSVRRAFTWLSKQISIRRNADSAGPRIHDIRHTFAVKTILRWYQNGSDVNQKMPLLSTYLGHTKPSNTYWYLTGTPHLLALAASRLER